MAALRSRLPDAPPFDARPVARIAAIVAVVGVVLTVIAIGLEPRRAMTSYLIAWAWVTTTALGALAFLLTNLVTDVAYAFADPRIRLS